MLRQGARVTPQGADGCGHTTGREAALLFPGSPLTFRRACLSAHRLPWPSALCPELWLPGACLPLPLTGSSAGASPGSALFISYTQNPARVWPESMLSLCLGGEEALCLAAACW